MLVIENQSDSCVQVNVNGMRPLVWLKRGDRIEFPDAKKDYVPYQNAISAFMQAGILRAVDHTQSVVVPAETLSPQQANEQISSEPVIIKKRRSKTNLTLED